VGSASVGLLQGTLDVIVLKTLSWGPMHGFGIARWIQQTTDDALRVEEGSLYPALYRMENRGWVRSQWRITDNHRRAKYYSLTPAGRRQLEAQRTSWSAFSLAMARIMDATRQPA